ncbi:MAG: RNA polymerase sigma factor [Planctomycetota bacterium]
MDASTLLEHRDFVTAVARALLRNESDVEDAVQETYVAALQSDPPRTGRVRPWLGGIARNVARNLRRTRTRRRRREEAVARPDRAAAQSTEKLRWQQRVVEEVLALESKYRDVLLLRYYEELPPREIAKQLDLPVNTVRTQTRRGVEQLRKRFDERYGRKAWSAALAAFFLGESAFAGKLVAAALVALVAGTAWVGHNALRGEADAPPRRSARSSETSLTAASEMRGGESSTNRTAEESSAPATFRGRLVDFDTKPHPPLPHATVYLTSASGEFDPIASATSDADGRFSFAWKKGWGTPGVIHGRSNHHLYVVCNGFWTDAMFTPGRALEEQVEIPVQLLSHPRFQFVQGDDRAPVVGARVSIHPVPRLRQPWLKPALASGITGADGAFEYAWETYRAAVLLRAVLPGGDTLQWEIEQSVVRSFDPYDIVVDATEIAAVTVRVLRADGKPSGPGTNVYVQGSWAPDGDSEEADWNALGRGAQPRPLIGVTDRDGMATFRFPADRAQHGVYVPRGMIAYDSKPRFAFREFADPRRLREQTARSGRSLPTLRFGSGTGTRPFFCVASEREGAYSVHWQGADGTTRQLEVYERARIPGFSVCQFTEAGPGSLRGRGKLTVAAEFKKGYAWAELDEPAFARCIRDGEVVRLERAHGMRSVQLRARSTCSFSLEAVEFPFVLEDWLNAGRARRFEIPDVPGLWRLRVGKLVRTFDPTQTTELEIDAPPTD